MIPFEELAASGIDRSTAARLNYRCTSDGGWEIPYLDPQGQPYTFGDGVPFVRRKLKPGLDPKYLTPSGAGNRPYFSPLLPKGYLQGTKPLLITEGKKRPTALPRMVSLPLGSPVFTGGGINAAARQPPSQSWQRSTGSGPSTSFSIAMSSSSPRSSTLCGP